MRAVRIIKNESIYLLFILGIILLASHELFVGGDYFNYKDPIINKGYIESNLVSNGWAANRIFGTSFFWADPGLTHKWSLHNLSADILSSSELGYTINTLSLIIFAGFAMYFFLRKINSQSSRIVSCLLAPTIILTYCFWQVYTMAMFGTILIIMLTYNHLKNPRVTHYFLASLLFWFIPFVGVIPNLSRTISVGFFFSLIYRVYYKEDLKNILLRYLSLIVIGGIGSLLLGFYIYYSLGLEYINTDYFRVKVKESSTIGINSFIPDLNIIITYLKDLFYFPWRSYSIVWPAYSPYSYHINAYFPIIFVYFLFRKSSTFWEFSFKWLIIIFWIHKLLSAIPIYSSLFSLVNSTIISFTYNSIYLIPIEIGLLYIFLSQMKRKGFMIDNLWGRRLQQTIASVIFMFYASLSLICIISFINSDLLPTLFSTVLDNITSEKLGKYPKDLFAFVGLTNIEIIQNNIHWYSLIYYFSTAVIAFPFIRYRWSLCIRNSKSVFVAWIIIINAILLYWTVYPLNTEEDVWDKVKSDSTVTFNSLDRFYFTKERPKDLIILDMRRNNYPDYIKNRFLNRRSHFFVGYKVGLEEPPFLHFSACVSFVQKEVSEYIYHIFNGDGTNRIKNVRSILGGPLISSDLLDMGAVNYYYSDREIRDLPNHLSLYYKTEDIYIYKNHSAWPYYYLADQLDIKEQGKHLENIIRGTAYVDRNDFYPLPENTQNSWIKLQDFKYGQMKFNYYGEQENFLVVADAWHPFWKAKINDDNLPVIKANEIFKGVNLPAGEGIVTFYFDTSPYFLGVYVSILAWCLFFIGLYLSLKYKWEFSMFEENNLQRRGRP